MCVCYTVYVLVFSFVLLLVLLYKVLLLHCAWSNQSLSIQPRFKKKKTKKKQHTIVHISSYYVVCLVVIPYINAYGYFCYHVSAICLSNSTPGTQPWRSLCALTEPVLDASSLLGLFAFTCVSKSVDSSTCFNVSSTRASLRRICSRANEPNMSS